MRKDDRLYLGHMLDLARRAIRAVRQVTLGQYNNDVHLRTSLAHHVQTIGEAARHVSKETRATLPGIPWEDVVGARHKIVHDYMNVDFNLVWGILNDDLPDLVSQLEPLGLGEEPEEES